MNKMRNIDKIDYKCSFNAYSCVVVSLTVRASSVESAIEKCKFILGESTVKDCLIGVNIELPF